MNTVLAAIDTHRSAHPEPDIHTIDVTPDLAQVWLGLNTANRCWNARRDGRSLRQIKVASPGKDGGMVAIPEPH